MNNKKGANAALFLKGRYSVETVKINTEYIKLEQLLKWAGIVDTGADAKTLIKEGKVKYNGATETQRGKKVRAGDTVELGGTVLKVE